MQAELTPAELETIAKMVTDKLHAKFVADESQKELQKACEKYTKQMIGYYLKENAVSYDVAKMIKPILDEHLKATDIVANHLRQYFTTEHFRQLEIRQLQNRIYELQRMEEAERE